MKIIAHLFGLVLLSLSIHAQVDNIKVCGTYADGYDDVVYTQLVLNEDSTFELTWTDPIFPYRRQDYTHSGQWSQDGESIRLNHNLKPRPVNVEVIERQIDDTDSITVKFSYVVNEYEQDTLVSSNPFMFEMLTVRLNDKKKAYNFRYLDTFRGCLFSPKVKNKILLDSLSTAKVPGKDLSTISIYSYGFKAAIVLEIENEKSNYLEIVITHPVDKERMPRDKEVLIKGDEAYIYESEGRLITNGVLSSLRKQN